MRTEFYNDFLRHQNFLHSCSVLTSEDRSTTSYITAVRSKRGGIFTPEEVALFECLASHLQTAVHIHQRTAGLESGLNAAAAALDRFPTGVIVVDSDAKVILINRMGEAILQRRDGLILSMDSLRAAYRQENTKLQNAVAAVSSQRGPGPQKPGTVLTVSRPSGLKSFEVLVAPLPPHSRLARGRPAAALFITDPEEGAKLDSQAMRQLFGLTPAEMRLAVALVGGQSVEEYAEKAGISSNTARTHVTRLYSKTGVRRQSELVGLLLKSSAGI
jgi:DNA-binding CsgD family transcriptional regulator